MDRKCSLEPINIHLHPQLASELSGGGKNQTSSPEQEAQQQDNYVKSLRKYLLYPGRPEGLHGEAHVQCLISKG